MKIYIGADHRGFKLKEMLKTFIKSRGFEIQDMGAMSLDPHDDYTLFAEKVATVISNEPQGRGILLCGSGVGVDVVANKFDNVRASIGISEEQVRDGRAHDNMNVLVIAADFTGEEKAAKLVQAFLHTSFDQKERHRRRLAEIAHLEENN